MDSDSAAGDVESLRGGLSLMEPLLDRILVDTVSQQQGWLRVYGKRNTHSWTQCRSRTHNSKESAGPRSPGTGDGR